MDLRLPPCPLFSPFSRKENLSGPPLSEILNKPLCNTSKPTGDIMGRPSPAITPITACGLRACVQCVNYRGGWDEWPPFHAAPSDPHLPSLERIKIGGKRGGERGRHRSKSTPQNPPIQKDPIRSLLNFLPFSKCRIGHWKRENFFISIIITVQSCRQFCL